MLARLLLIPAILVTGWFAEADPPKDETREPQTIVVRMVDVSATEYKFEPAAITVHHGDIVQFVQTTVMPHNVEFKDVGDAQLPVDRVGPYLTAPEQTYEVPITEAFAPGDYKFVCTPHEYMGMTGLLTVEAGN